MKGNNRKNKLTFLSMRYGFLSFLYYLLKISALRNIKQSEFDKVFYARTYR